MAERQGRRQRTGRSPKAACRDEQQSHRAVRGARRAECHRDQQRSGAYCESVRFLLRPGWLAFIAVVLAFVVTCYALLAPWQFGREAERDAQRQAIDHSSAIAPVPLAELISPAGVERDVQWRRVEVTGTYLPEAEALVRLRVVDGRPAFEVLTPLRADGGTVIIVNRGSVAAPDGRVVPAYPAPPTGPVTLTGRLRVDHTDPESRPPFTAEGHRQVYAADSHTLAAATGLDLVAGHVQLAEAQPGVLDPIPVTPSTGGAPFTNLSYALQWLTFGAIALFAMVYFVRLELLQRRPGNRSDFRRALSGHD